MSSVANLDFIAPAFADLDTSIKETAIQFAGQRISARAFGRLYAQAVAYLAAHIIASTIEGAGADAGIAGQITSVKTGDLAIGSSALAGVVGTDAALARTPYGASYLEIKNKITGPYIR